MIYADNWDSYNIFVKRIIFSTNTTEANYIFIYQSVPRYVYLEITPVVFEGWVDLRDGFK